MTDALESEVDMALAADRAQKPLFLTGRRWALAGAVALFGAAAGTAAWLAASQAPWPNPQRLAALWWFDPYFLAYNLFLAAFAVLIVPAIVYFYMRLMSSEKCRRLRRAMTDEEWRAHEPELRPLVERQFRVRNYVGSVLAAMAVISAGVLLLLLSKPYLPAEAGLPTVLGNAQGIDYGRGANVLLLGPFIERYGSALGDFYHQLVISLTAFQFGFLGAYVYFITSLLRSYFTLDLSTHTVVGGTIRMVTSSVLALVLSFALPGLMPGAADDDAFLRTLPVFAFFIGYFPNRGLLWLDRVGTKMLGLGHRKYRQTLLSNLTGISSAHELRFEREGVDNIENMAHADALELAVRTGFGYRQLRDWIGEARLRLAMGEDFDHFVRKTWLRTEPQVCAFYDAWSGTPNSATRHLAEACGEEMKPRIRNLALLLGCERADGEEDEEKESEES